MFMWFSYWYNINLLKQIIAHITSVNCCFCIQLHLNLVVRFCDIIVNQ